MQLFVMGHAQDPKSIVHFSESKKNRHSESGATHLFVVNIKNSALVPKKPPFWRKMYQKTPQLQCTKKTSKCTKITPPVEFFFWYILEVVRGFFWYLAGGSLVYFGVFFGTFQRGGSMVHFWRFVVQLGGFCSATRGFMIQFKGFQIHVRDFQYSAPPFCISYTLVQATVSVRTVRVVYLL